MYDDINISHGWTQEKHNCHKRPIHKGDGVILCRTDIYKYECMSMYARICAKETMTGKRNRLGVPKKLEQVYPVACNTMQLIITNLTSNLKSDCIVLHTTKHLYFF